MQDTIVEEILRAPSLRERFREQPRQRGRFDSVIPAANRYPHKLRRAELEHKRQPWAAASKGTHTSVPIRFV